MRALRVFSGSKSYRIGVRTNSYFSGAAICASLNFSEKGLRLLFYENLAGGGGKAENICTRREARDIGVRQECA